MSKCRCGICCEGITVLADDEDAEREPLIRQMATPIPRDACGHTYRLSRPGTGDRPGPCVFFRRDGDVGICAIHDTKPEHCRRWDCDSELGRKALVQLGVLGHGHRQE